VAELLLFPLLWLVVRVEKAAVVELTVANEAAVGAGFGGMGHAGALRPVLLGSSSHGIANSEEVFLYDGE